MTLPYLSQVMHGHKVPSVKLARRLAKELGWEIEEVLLRNKAVSETAVIGLDHPDWGEEVVAFVVPRDGTVLEEAALDRLCLDNLARFKRPRQYRFVDALPKNNYGKVLKTELRALLAKGDAE